MIGKISNMALCNGRHEMLEAADGSIFGNIIDPLDVAGLEDKAYKMIEVQKCNGSKGLNLYVTGLSVALAAVINACIKIKMPLVLYHYDKEGRKYYPQAMRTTYHKEEAL